MANYKYPFKDKAGKDVVDADVYYSALGMASGGYYVFGPSGVHSGIHYESAMANLLSLDEGIGAMTKGEVVAYRINREYPTSPGAAKVPTTAESTSAAFSTGFVLTRHTLEYPTGNKLTYFCLAMHLRSFGDYERMGSVVKRPAYWPAKICRVKETAKEKQTVPKGATDQPVIGLSVRAKPSFAKDSPVLGYLPHGARFTVLQRDKQWVKIKRVIEKAIVPPSTAQTEVPAAAHSGWVSMSWLEARGQAPEDFDVVVTPASPPAVKAGELLGHMGEYRRVQDPGQSRRLMHHEIIVGPELRAFLEKSRAAAARATPQQKTLLRVAPDAQLHNPVLAPPQAGLLPVNTIVALDGTPPDDALYVKVKPTAVMQWIDRKAKLPTGAKEANLFRLNDGAVYTAADIVRVPRQGTVGQPGATRFRGVFVGAASQTPVWITKDAYTALVSVQGGKLLTADLAQGWVSFPLKFAANGPKNGAFPQIYALAVLERARAAKENPVELPKAFASDEAGNAWWQVKLTNGGTTATGWVGEVGHAGISLHSPHEWVDFKLIEAKPTGVAYGSYFADFKQMEDFQRGKSGLKDGDLDAPLREVRALLDVNHDGQLTLAELKATQRDQDTIRQLSRVILRYPSEWKADKNAWDAYDALIPASMKTAWGAEKARIAKLVWWDDVAGKVKDFPDDSSVFHIHPVAFVENRPRKFRCINYKVMYAPVGPRYRDSEIVDHSLYRVPIDTTHGRLAGLSRVHGDASKYVQRRVIDEIVDVAGQFGLTREEIALVLAIARVESGFNPDSAAGTTSAAGLGQFVDRTGRSYGLFTNEQRFDARTNADALVRHTLDNMKIVKSRYSGRELYLMTYAVHHDGPGLSSGGRQISERDVMPYFDLFLDNICKDIVE